MLRYYLHNHYPTFTLAMKKRFTTAPILFSIMCAVSLSCSIYLHSSSSQQLDMTITTEEVVQQDILPDIRIIDVLVDQLVSAVSRQASRP